MAASIGALKSSPSSHNCINERRNDSTRAISSRNLSFSSSHLAGDKLMPVSSLRSQGVRFNVRRSPLIVSPKAVSDSQNSQTCLDPDASRVSKFQSILS